MKSTTNSRPTRGRLRRRSRPAGPQFQMGPPSGAIRRIAPPKIHRGGGLTHPPPCAGVKQNVGAAIVGTPRRLASPSQASHRSIRIPTTVSGKVGFPTWWLRDAGRGILTAVLAALISPHREKGSRRSSRHYNRGARSRRESPGEPPPPPQGGAPRARSGLVLGRRALPTSISSAHRGGEAGQRRPREQWGFREAEGRGDPCRGGSSSWGVVLHAPGSRPEQMRSPWVSSTPPTVVATTGHV